MSASRLENLKSNFGMKWSATDSTLEVETPHALAQAVGYIKYARRDQGAVYFRGQDDIYPQMRPSLYRGAKSQGGKQKRDEQLNTYTLQTHEADAFIPKTPEYTHEPILQHYGIKTRWLDLVDNVWTALWFGCQEVHHSGPDKRYLHFEPSNKPYAYIVLLQAGAETHVADKPGLMRTTSAEIIDLRRAAPSTYLRPHAQHAILMRKLNCNTLDKTDMSNFIVGAIKIKMTRARTWLGGGDLVSTRHFFPPPKYDGGYSRFLKILINGSQTLGFISHIGA